MSKIVSPAALHVNTYAMFFNIGRIFCACFLSNSMKKDDILSEFNRLVLLKWVVELMAMPLCQTEMADRLDFGIKHLQGDIAE